MHVSVLSVANPRRSLPQLLSNARSNKPTCINAKEDLGSGCIGQIPNPPSLFRSKFLFMRIENLCPHNIVARINKHDFARDGASIMTAQEESGIAHIALFDIATQRGHMRYLIAESG